MTKQNNYSNTILKINPLKLRELLPAYELNTLANCLTIFKKIETSAPQEIVLYAEKTTLEIAFEAYSSMED
ncbi:hypothetical protein ACFOWA_11960 [Pedobacter lithocola]|uniref:Uncharacterized protein n=1 Tax=Pedobacter lithocola TaxID=1908239 RepID=A0ABV8PCQ9_9SPHI